MSFTHAEQHIIAGLKTHPNRGKKTHPGGDSGRLYSHSWTGLEEIFFTYKI